MGRPRFQMALSGRATARMIEATSESATTIAGFLSRASETEMGMHLIVVIDEASMLDLVTFYRLVRKLPSDTHLILVGDPYQLPPIGAGLVLHVLCGHSEIAQAQLTEVKRQSKASEIPSAAQAIREGRWPDFTSDEGGEVILLPTSDAEIIPTVLRLYDQKRDGTQILCATRSCRFAGVDALNRTCHTATLVMVGLYWPSVQSRDRLSPPDSVSGICFYILQTIGSEIFKTVALAS